LKFCFCIFSWIFLFHRLGPSASQTAGDDDKVAEIVKALSLLSVTMKQPWCRDLMTELGFCLPGQVPEDQELNDAKDGRPSGSRPSGSTPVSPAHVPAPKPAPKATPTPPTPPEETPSATPPAATSLKFRSQRLEPRSLKILELGLLSSTALLTEQPMLACREGCTLLVKLSAQTWRSFGLAAERTFDVFGLKNMLKQISIQCDSHTFS
jgi:hypothetical protein